MVNVNHMRVAVAVAGLEPVVVVVVVVMVTGSTWMGAEGGMQRWVQVGQVCLRQISMMWVFVA